jgi:hypothetical protein
VIKSAQKLMLKHSAAAAAAAACRKRIKAIRQALEKKGWATTGY